MIDISKCIYYEGTRFILIIPYNLSIADYIGAGYFTVKIIGMSCS